MNLKSNKGSFRRYNTIHKKRKYKIKRTKLRCIEASTIDICCCCRSLLLDNNEPVHQCYLHNGESNERERIKNEKYFAIRIIQIRIFFCSMYHVPSFMLINVTLRLFFFTFIFDYLFYFILYALLYCEWKGSKMRKTEVASRVFAFQF